MADKPEKDASSASSLKMPYNAPVLATWGTLREITQSVGKTGAIDGGKGKSTKTRP
jgi:hypothetical protein